MHNDSIDSKNDLKTSKKVSLASVYDFELLNKRSIENSLYEYANDMIKSYRVKKLFEMFSNLNFLSFSRWIQRCQ
jgi:hypothetical protein